MDQALLSDATHYLEHWLKYRRRTLRIPGLVAAVSHQGQLLLHLAAGQSDLEASTPMATDMPFPVASHSKTFTTAICLRLVEQGRLRLSDRLDRWLPDTPPELAAVEVGDLLSHSAGLSRDSTDSDFWQLDRAFPARDQLLAMAGPVLGRYERLKYSNIGFGLVGQVLEAATGATYEQIVRAELLEPLGLQDTTCDVLGRDCPVGYTARRGGAARQPLALPSAGGLAPATGFCTTAADLCAFATALCDGDDRLLSAESRRLMRRTVWTGEAGDNDYGLGLNAADVAGRRVYGHGGAYPGFLTSTRFDPAEELVAVILGNGIDAPATELSQTVMALIARAQECPPGSGPRGMTGRYSSMWGIHDVVGLGAQLLALDPELPDPWDRRMELEPTADDRSWTVTRGSGFGIPGEQVTFDSDSARFGGMTLRRDLRW